MAIWNMTKEKACLIRIHVASGFFPRLIGLLGTVRPDRKWALLINPCNGIHTIGMRYPIDVLFLDRDGRVLEKVESLKPNRWHKPALLSASVLELVAGEARLMGIEEGDLLRILPDQVHQPGFSALGNLLQKPLDVLIAFLWARFVYTASIRYTGDGQWMNLGILVHNTLLAFFFLTRRRTIETTSRPLDWGVPLLTLGATLMLRPSPASGSLPEVVSAILQAAGMTGIILSLISLGNSFGIVPANRTIVRKGAYRLVRHPMYTSEIIFYTGFLSGNPSPRNIFLVLGILAGQLWRALLEERLLCHDPDYRTYGESVRHRFIPGLF
ncbi:DUF192 domain-containing protein [bacterium]|nr:DUF192 domain-containing protein [bacterium]